MSDQAARRPWDMMEGEKPTHYAIFQAYLAMRPAKRSIRGAQEGLGVRKRHTYNVARTWKWIERAEAYDRSLREQRDAEQRDFVDGQGARERELAIKTLDLAEANVEMVAEKVQEAKEKGDGAFVDPKMVKEAVQAAKIANEVFRTAANLPQQIRETRNTGENTLHVELHQALMEGAPKQLEPPSADALGFDVKFTKEKSDGHDGRTEDTDTEAD